jgi:hypothetical protein
MMDRPAARNDAPSMKTTANTHSLLRTLAALTFAALLMSHAIADPAEPRRVFDAEKERFVPNPDYREPVTVRRTSPLAEPRRIFHAESERFVSNPAYHAPAANAKIVHQVGQPRRIFDAEKERFVTNPDYHNH